MNDLTGALRIPSRVIPTIDLKAVLQYYEEPLLLSVSMGEEDCLMRWTDQGDGVTRWLTFKTTSSDIQRIKEGDMSLLQALESADGLLLLVDMHSETSEVICGWVTPMNQIPEDYLPSEGSFLMKALIPEEMS